MTSSELAYQSRQTEKLLQKNAELLKQTADKAAEEAGPLQPSETKLFLRDGKNARSRHFGAEIRGFGAAGRG